MTLPTPQILLDPTLLTALGLVLGTAGKMLFDYISKRLRPHEDPSFEKLRKELLEEAEDLRKELREEVTRLRGRITELESEVDHWKYRYFSALQSIGSCEHMTDCKGRCPLLTRDTLFPTHKLTVYEPPPDPLRDPADRT